MERPTPSLETAPPFAVTRHAPSPMPSHGPGAWILCLLLLLPHAAKGTELAPIGTERDLSRQVISGSQSAFYPYSFVDKEGELKGFAVDLIRAVAREMKLDLKTREIPNIELNNAIQSGRVDLIPLLSETPVRRASLDFSVPILRFETVIVVRKGTRFGSPVDLSGKHVAVGQQGTVGELYAIEQHPGAIREYAATTEEQIRKLSEGSYDALVMSRLTAITLIERLKLKNLAILEGTRGYDVRYCTAVRKGDALLLARINEGLAVLHRTGEFEIIYEKWFGRYSRSSFTYGEIASAIAGMLALLSALALWAFLRQRSLSRRITRQADELAEQRSLLAALYDKHPLATLVVEIPDGGDARLVSLNQEATLLYGLEKNGSIEHPISRLNLSDELLPVLKEAVVRQGTNDLPEHWETQLPRTKRLLEFTTVPLGHHRGARRICILTADITKRRLMDQEIARSRRLRALGELVGGIAHEFNNLLTPILATSSLLRSSPPPITVSNEELAIIDQAALRAADLTKRLLAFGRKIDDPAKTVRLSEAVANCEALLKTMVDRRILWENDLPSDLPPVSFNPTDFNQIVFNLVLNARDTLLEKLARNPDPAWRPRLRVSVAELPATRTRTARNPASLDGITGWQRFSVEDNGMGIPHDIIDRIFEPFYTTKEVGKGTGLGLSMVWHQVTEAGGDVEVESKPGEGTVFHLYFPRRDTRPPLPVLPGKESNAPVAPAPLRARILIVEDEPLISSAAAKIAERMGHAVTVHANGQKAWEALSSKNPPFDLMLIDLSMPQMNGVDLVRLVRTQPFAGRIVVMSGRVSDEDLRILKELKVDRLLPKPFTTSQLMSVISELTQQPS